MGDLEKNSEAVKVVGPKFNRRSSRTWAAREGGGRIDTSQQPKNISFFFFKKKVISLSQIFVIIVNEIVIIKYVFLYLKCACP